MKVKVKHASVDEVPWSKLRRAHRRMIINLYPDLSAAELQSAIWSHGRDFGWFPMWCVMRDDNGDGLVYKYGDYRQFPHHHRIVENPIS